MPATTKDIRIEQGTTFRLVVTVLPGVPEDITGYTAAMQVRPYRASLEVLADLDENEITVNNITRQVVVTIPASVTETYDWREGDYDLVITGVGGKFRLVQGRAVVSPSVTREG